jgi:hypothetical protein
MSDVDKVALWTGLIGSVVGIVLSIVAIILSIVSNNRATAVNDQTIKSLQKIESAVERLSDDSRTLIKAGWDKMLGNVDHPQEQHQEIIPVESIGAQEHDLPSVTSTDLEAENTSSAESNSDDRFAALESKLEALQRLAPTRTRYGDRQSTPTQSVDALTSILSTLSPRAQALFDVVSRSRHLEEDQLEALEASDLGPEISELRKAGLIVRLLGQGPNKPTVYWLPNKYTRVAAVATQLAPRIAPSLLDEVRTELKKFGYSPR